MRYAIPMADGKLCMHFGHCERFMFVEADEASRGVTESEYVTPPPHAPGVLPQWLQERGIDVVLAGGMGSRARTMLEDAGVTVVTGVPDEAPEALVQAHLAGTLVSGENTCDH
jgi:ATP-binding protein involved in chromosome partitioning